MTPRLPNPAFASKMIAMLLLLASSSSVLAHTGSASAGGFLAGLAHPLIGLDHLLAMLAVGLWASMIGRPALRLLPIVFPLLMVFGGALAMSGISLPGVETGIALSALVLGLMVVFAVKLPLAMAAVIVGIFAIVHGHAHATELPATANVFTYTTGFVITTTSLHLFGIALGKLTEVKYGKYIVHGTGALIAMAGTAFLAGMA